MTQKCTICNCTFTEDEGGTSGDLGMLPVSFCPSCFSGLCEMIDQVDDREWVGLNDEDISEIVRGTHNTGSFVRAIEAKLRQKNT